MKKCVENEYNENRLYNFIMQIIEFRYRNACFFSNLLKLIILALQDEIKTCLS